VRAWLVSSALDGRPAITVSAVDQATREVRIARQLEQGAGDDSGVGEVGEHAVDAELIELQVLVHGVAAVVGRQALLLVAEGPRVHQETVRMGPLNEVRSRQQGAVGLVDMAVAVLVADAAVVVEVLGDRGDSRAAGS
jgi:hypothetical protein